MFLSGLLICCGSMHSERFEVYPDNIFKYHNKRFITDDSLSMDYNKVSRGFNLNKLTVKDRGALTDQILGVNNLYNAYFYSKQNKIDNLTPILILADADDYQSVILFVVSNEGKVINYLELTNDACDVLEQIEEKEIVGCRQRDSEFLNDSTIRVKDLRHRIDGYKDENGLTTTDSLTTDYRITSKGLIKAIKKDSAHYVRNK
jgi:hypothetical protein